MKPLATPEQLEEAAQDERIQGPGSPCRRCENKYAGACRCPVWQLWFYRRWAAIQKAAGVARRTQEGE